MEQLFSEFINKLILSGLILISNLNTQTLNIQNIELIPENKVVRVIDGDTFEVYKDGKVHKVRMIGIDTPESVDPRTEIECFGIEASEKLKELINGKIVTLEEDETQDSKDRYGRLLRYVYLDETNINNKMLEEGFAFEYTYQKKYKYYDEFKKSEISAREKQIGMWDKNICNY